MNLGMTPTAGIAGQNYIYIVLIVLIILSTFLSFKNSMSSQNQTPEMEQQMKFMFIFMIIMISFASLSLPTAIALSVGVVLAPVVLPFTFDVVEIVIHCITLLSKNKRGFLWKPSLAMCCFRFNVYLKAISRSIIWYFSPLRRMVWRTQLPSSSYS